MRTLITIIAVLVSTSLTAAMAFGTRNSGNNAADQSCFGWPSQRSISWQT
jgi:hypothetical protein